MAEQRLNKSGLVASFLIEEYAKHQEHPVFTNINGRDIVVPYEYVRVHAENWRVPFVKDLFGLHRDDVKRAIHDYRHGMDSSDGIDFVNIDGINVPVTKDMDIDFEGDEQSLKHGLVTHYYYQNYINKYKDAALSALEAKTAAATKTNELNPYTKFGEALIEEIWAATTKPENWEKAAALSSAIIGQALEIGKTYAKVAGSKINNIDTKALWAKKEQINNAIKSLRIPVNKQTALIGAFSLAVAGGVIISRKSQDKSIERITVNHEPKADRFGADETTYNASSDWAVEENVETRVDTVCVKPQKTPITPEAKTEAAPEARTETVPLKKIPQPALVTESLKPKNVVLSLSKKQRETRQDVYEAGQKAFGGDSELLVVNAGIVSMECSFNAEATAETSSAMGTHQFLNNTWMEQASRDPKKYAAILKVKVEDIKKIKEKEDAKGRIVFTTGDAKLDKKLLNKRKNSEISAMMGANLLLKNKKMYEKEFGEMSADEYSELYAIHHHGWGNYKFFRKHLNKDITDSKQYKKVVEANPWIKKYRFEDVKEDGSISKRAVKTGKDMIEVVRNKVEKHIDAERMSFANDLEEQLMDGLKSSNSNSYAANTSQKSGDRG